MSTEINVGKTDEVILTEYYDLCVKGNINFRCIAPALEVSGSVIYRWLLEDLRPKKSYEIHFKLAIQAIQALFSEGTLPVLEQEGVKEIRKRTEDEVVIRYFALLDVI